ncbi:MAG: hypothetical protein ACJAVV_000179 [Alphaproteobacteria bacterium]|jgi:hypothetical protein
MPHKKAVIATEPASNDALGELEQLRLIVFGKAKEDLEIKIEALKQSLAAQMSDMNSNFALQFEAINSQIKAQFNALTASIDGVDSTREANKFAFEEDNTSLSSQLEMTDNSSKDDSDLIHKRIDE